MDRWLSRVVTLAVIGLAGYLAFRGIPARTPIATAPVDAGVDAGPPEKAAAVTGVDAGDSEGGMLLADLKDLDLAPSDDAGSVGTLGEKAPRSVHLGVVLVSFHGAQGAPTSARPKQEARELAEKLAADAKTDFHRAVQRGDSGSSDDVGRVPRGVLEPSTEYVVFSLSPGAVTEVLETPRGFWIAKRLD